MKRTSASSPTPSSSSTIRTPLWRAREDFWFADGDVLIVAGSGGRIAFWDWESWNASPCSTDTDDSRSDERTLCEDNTRVRACSSHIDVSASFLVHSAVLNRAGSSTFYSRLEDGRLPPDSDSESDEDEDNDFSSSSSSEEISIDGEVAAATLNRDLGDEDAQPSAEVDVGCGDFDFSESETLWKQKAGLPEDEDLVEIIRASDDRYDIECLLHALYFGIDPTCSHSFLDAVLRISRKYDMTPLYAAARRQMTVLYDSSTAPLMVVDPLDQWEKGIFDAFSIEDESETNSHESETKSKNVLSIPIDTPPLLHRQSSHDTPQPMMLPAPIAFY